MTGLHLIYTEQDVEDLLEDDALHYLGIKYIARQMRTPVGVLDVLARHPGGCDTYYVVEIKKGTLDAAAYVQVMRYTKYLNSERSKNGKRLFVPLLIGASLGDELTTICEYFEPEEYHYRLIGQVYYRLFNFDPKAGVAFTWSSVAQRKHRDALEFNFSHPEHIGEDRDFYEFSLRRREREPLGGPRLVTSDAAS